MDSCIGLFGLHWGNNIFDLVFFSGSVNKLPRKELDQYFPITVLTNYFNNSYIQNREHTLLTELNKILK